MALENLVEKIGKCANYEMLFCLEEDFNSIGLTLQPTKQNKVVLCKLKSGVPLARRIFEDYIHIGSLEDRSKEIPHRLLECIREFTENNVGKPDSPKNVARSWQSAQTGLYGSFINAQNDIPQISQIADELTDEEPVVAPKEAPSYLRTAVMSVANISEDMEKDKVIKESVHDDRIKKMGKLLEG
jgi:hypothetical protein